MSSIINTFLFCVTLLGMTLMILLALPKSKLRCVLLETIGWACTALAAIYVVSPIDLIPDFIPVLGWVDDGGAIVGGIASAIMAMSARSDRSNVKD